MKSSVEGKVGAVFGSDFRALTSGSVSTVFGSEENVEGSESVFSVFGSEGLVTLVQRGLLHWFKKCETIFPH